MPLQDYQSWWKGGHIHLGGLFPTMEKVTSDFPIEIRLQLHDMVGGLVRKVVFGCGGLKDQLTLDEPVTLHHQEWRVPFMLSPSRILNSGWYKLGLQAMMVTPDGLNLNIATDQDIEIVNGKPNNGKTFSNLTGSTSWMPDDEGNGPHGYCNADIITTALPRGPLSGSVEIPVKVVSQAARDTVRGEARIDPNIHAGYPGTQIQLWTGQKKFVLIDTHVLSNGEHKLMIRAHDEGILLDGDLSSVFVWPFTVQN